jgi:hypothetical protein
MADALLVFLGFLIPMVPFLIAYALAIGGTIGRTRRRVVMGGALALVLLAVGEVVFVLNDLEGLG